MNFFKRIVSFCVSTILLLFSSVSLSEQTPEAIMAIFAGGCFWCMQADFDKVPGVIQTVVGYTGGYTINPNYTQVSSGVTGHYEAIQVIYDPAKISYEQLLDIFWHNIDPTNSTGQFCDEGQQYKAVIFYSNVDQEKLAFISRQQLIKSRHFSNVATEILPATIFYPAEKYHQKFYKKNPIRYHFYRYYCGRDQRLRKLWE
ncbi:MAG TPA: peptide-methionine (S)-S-oxide reductase MsrA [Gammaproteobacteria bacterium]|nr:peptide-methionine (S)-S-oxide reductase MsrA [Gammaproteobacteria bacterium]